MHFILLLAFSLTSVQAAERDWRYHARRLTGFSDATHRSSLAALKQMRDMPALLTDALKGPDRFLALDVISTLSFTSLLPILIEAVPGDESGAVALGINALLTPQTRPTIIQAYSKFLSDLNRHPLSVPTTMAILDVLGRMRHPLAESQVELFMQFPAPMVRSAAVYYARMLRASASDERYRAVFERGLRDPTDYIRTQTRAAVGSAFVEPVDTFWTRLRRFFSGSPIQDGWPQSPPPQALLSPLTETPILDSKQKQVCESTYNHFYKNAQTDIRLVFGYKDARPSRFVGDRYEAAWFESYLTAPCQEGWFACGFTRDSSDPGLFRKLITGPDGRARDIRVTLVSSAAGADDDENRKDVFQRWLSDRAATVFLDGVEKADAVFYDGHSRDGGGPDFSPPRLASDKHVDYDWYVKHKPGMAPLLDRLAKSRLALLGFFSCASTGHFVEGVGQANAAVATITSPKLIYYSDAMKNMLAALSALLGRKCEADFHTSLRATVEVGDSQISGFFKAD